MEKTPPRFAELPPEMARVRFENGEEHMAFAHELRVEA